jgi:hypothetical protein
MTRYCRTVSPEIHITRTSSYERRGEPMNMEGPVFSI